MQGRKGGRGREKRIWGDRGIVGDGRGLRMRGIEGVREGGRQVGIDHEERKGGREVVNFILYRH